VPRRPLSFRDRRAFKGPQDQFPALNDLHQPVWAIGTGRTATAAQAGEAHAHIRTRLRQWFGGDSANRCRVIHGGSVKPDNINIKEIIAEQDLDGALVGGASLDSTPRASPTSSRAAGGLLYNQGFLFR
jgi:hypothetical protein